MVIIRTLFARGNGVILNLPLISERLFHLTLEERRENYFCGPKGYKQLSDIPTWQEQYIENKKSLSEKGLFVCT